MATPNLGPLAQWLEHPAHNRAVLGSNPRGPTFTGEYIFHDGRIYAKVSFSEGRIRVS